MKNSREAAPSSFLSITLFVTSSLLCLTACTPQETTSALDTQIAQTKAKLVEIKSQFSQYSGVTALEPLVRARYLITLQTLDMLEQRRAAKFYDIHLSYTAESGELEPEKDLLEKDLALQEARSAAALKRSKISTLLDAEQGENPAALRWRMLLLDLQIAQIEYRLAALRNQFPEVVGGPELDNLVQELEEKYSTTLSESQKMPPVETKEPAS